MIGLANTVQYLLERRAMESAHDVERDRPAVAWALLVARVIVGVIFMAHGAQKLFGAFGGPGLAGVVKMLGPIGYLVTVDEFFGGLGLLVGVLSRFSAFWLIVDMIGAIVLVHGRNGFFLGANPGFEYCLALIGLLATILLAGPGRLSLGRRLPLSRHVALE
jgi:putative oxidoreductase